MTKSQIKNEIAQVNAALERVRADHQRALAEITDRGLSVIVTVLDSHGREVRKPGLNPAAKVIVSAERLERALSRRLRDLREELQKIQERREPDPWSKFAPKERKRER